MPHNTSKRLLTLFSHGDPEVIQLLYQKHRPALIKHISSLTNNPAHVEAIIQETYQRIWQSAHRYEADKDSLSNWMVTIAHNTAEAYLDAL